MNSGPVRGCASWRDTGSDTRRQGVYAYTIRARCHGKRIRLRFRQSAFASKYWGSGRVFGRNVRFSGRLADGDYRPARLTLSSRNLTRYGDGTWHTHEVAGFSLGRTSFYCVKVDPDGRGRWAVDISTMPVGASHYHNRPTRAQRRGLPFGLCVTLLTAGESQLPPPW